MSQTGLYAPVFDGLVRLTIAMCRSPLCCIVVLGLLAISGCCSIPVDHEKLKSEEVALDSLHYYTDQEMAYRFRDEWKRGEELVRPQVGLALAGGGTKAAAFSLGVIQGLQETKLMERVDVVSTVSGGSYAGLWYYSRLHEDSLGKAFTDCIAQRYSFFQSARTEIGLLCPDTKTNFDPCKPEEDRYRYQNYLRGHQDVFSIGRNILGLPSFRYFVSGKEEVPFNYEPSGRSLKVKSDIASLLGLTVASLPPHLVANGVFDWDIPLSPSRRAYVLGIDRTYSATPNDCSELIKQERNNPHDKKYCGESRDPGKIIDVLHMNGVSFEVLADLHKGGAPMWIINATGSEERSVFSLSEPSHPELTVFEFTPYGSGSGLFTYDIKPLFTKVSVIEAVGVSAAFLDSQQKNYKKPPIRNAINALLKLSNLNWGLSYPNPNSNRMHRIFHKFLPFPFYLIHKHNQGRDSVYIRLSDGGMSENLGVYALIRRGVTTLIISDNAEDRGGCMADLCRLRSVLAERGLNLDFPGLKDLDCVCDRINCPNPEIKGACYNIFNWRHPVLLGKLSNSEMAADNSPTYEANVFLIKPAIGGSSLMESIAGLREKCMDNVEGEQCTEEMRKRCRHFGNDDPYGSVRDSEISKQHEEKLSCELLGFILYNAKGDGLHKDRCPHFPQHRTHLMTVDSSPWMYGAYRELGRYYSKQLAWFLDQGVDREMLDDRFKKEFCNQTVHPIEPEITKDRKCNTNGCLNIDSTQKCQIPR